VKSLLLAGCALPRSPWRVNGHLKPAPFHIFALLETLLPVDRELPRHAKFVAEWARLQGLGEFAMWSKGGAEDAFGTVPVDLWNGYYPS
jgi:hypothetical protein